MRQKLKQYIGLVEAAGEAGTTPDDLQVGGLKLHDSSGLVYHYSSEKIAHHFKLTGCFKEVSQVVLQENNFVLRYMGATPYLLTIFTACYW